MLDGPRPHLVLEHLEGPRLSSLLRRYGPLLTEQAVALGIEICAAIHYLGGRGIVHLDVKPSNLIMGAPPRLIDLSVARSLAGCERLRSPAGTDAYMAPEQADLARGGLGPAADVWGLAATMHEALTGELPYPRGRRRAERPADRFPQLDAGAITVARSVAGPLREPLVACLAPDPDDRPSPAELAEQLQVVLDGLPRPRLAALKPRR